VCWLAGKDHLFGKTQENMNYPPCLASSESFHILLTSCDFLPMRITKIWSVMCFRPRSLSFRWSNYSVAHVASWMSLGVIQRVPGLLARGSSIFQHGARWWPTHCYWIPQQRLEYSLMNSLWLQAWAWLGPSPNAWTHSTGVEPDDRQALCSEFVPTTCVGVVHPSSRSSRARGTWGRSSLPCTRS